MRIESSQLSYVAAHRSMSTTVRLDETLPGTGSSGSPVVASSLQGRDIVQLSGQAWSPSQNDREDLEGLDPTQRLAVLAIEAFLGHRIKLLRVGSSSNASAAARTADSGAALHRVTELHAESEQTSFQAEGIVETADGRRIQFSAQLNMEREYQSQSVTVGSAQTTDPLIVNYGGSPARLTAAKVAFDLNSDGDAESISFVAEGSGFLVLDANGDGKVNDGRELFGPQTGNGFSELASYDADGNQWIDESDPVFSQLRIWTQDGLSTLTAKGIGAIAISSVVTPFALKDSGNNLQGNVLSSGVFLSENGNAGTIQQVDLATG